jgi:hypothetical protein
VSSCGHSAMTETRSGSGTMIDQKVYDEAMGTWLFSGRHRKFDQSRQSFVCGPRMSQKVLTA